MIGITIRLQHLATIVNSIITYISGARIVTEAGDGLLAESGDQLVTE